MKTIKTRHCIYCGKILTGRTDKLFCSMQCKNEYHNGLTRLEKQEHKRIIASLSNNFRILKKCLTEKRRIHDLEDLKADGFDPQLFTGHKRNWTGLDEYACLTISYSIDRGKVYNIVLQHPEPTEHLSDPSADPSSHQ